MCQLFIFLLDIFYLTDYEKIKKLKKEQQQCKSHKGTCLDNFNCSNFNDNRECPVLCNKQNCKNRRIESELNQFNLQIKKYEGKGSGVRTLDFILAGAYVIEYVGFIRTEDEYRELWNKHPENPLYGIEYRNDYVIDATQQGNLCKFLVILSINRKNKFDFENFLF